MGEDRGLRHAIGVVKYWAFRFAAELLPWVPIQVAYPLARLVGVAMCVALPGTRRLVSANLSHIPGLEDAPVRQRAVRGAFESLTLNYLDLFRVRRLTPAQVLQEYSIEGEQLFRSALAQGRGVLLISAHLGNFELAAARLGLFGVPVILPTERTKPERLFALTCHLRTHHGVHIVPVDRTDSLRAIYAALRRGEIVSLAVDRDVLGTGIEMPLFGAPARLPTGAVLLARRSGAAVLWASSWRDASGRSHGEFEPADFTQTEGSAATTDDTVGEGPARATRPRGQAAFEQALGPVVAQVERKVAEHPEQWLAAFTPLWPDAAAHEEDEASHV